ncbi:kinesin heavy chain [Sarcoptes scabiei]|nr:kinesin heavy chain [Sarcoptes scabiei]
MAFNSSVKSEQQASIVLGHRSKTSINVSMRRNNSLLIPIVIALLVQMVLLAPKSSARYLPTRNQDQTQRRQEIKEILRILLDMPNNDEYAMSNNQPSQGWSLNGLNLNVPYEMNPIRSVRNAPVGDTQSASSSSSASQLLSPSSSSSLSSQSTKTFFKNQI